MCAELFIAESRNKQYGTIPLSDACLFTLKFTWVFLKPLFTIVFYAEQKYFFFFLLLFYCKCLYNRIVFNHYYSLSFEGIGNDQILALGSALLNKWVSSSLHFAFPMFFVFVHYLGHLAPVLQLHLWAGSSPWRWWCWSNPGSVGWCWAVWPQP